MASTSYIHKPLFCCYKKLSFIIKQTLSFTFVKNAFQWEKYVKLPSFKMQINEWRHFPLFYSNEHERCYLILGQNLKNKTWFCLMEFEIYVWNEKQFKFSSSIQIMCVFRKTCLKVVVISAHTGKPRRSRLWHFMASLIIVISWRLKKILKAWQAKNIPTIPINTTAKLSSSLRLAWWLAVTRPHVLCLRLSSLSLISFQILNS